ncbi:MAG: 4Fe-4S dicluster domain-containing protein [Chloroflexota bacterium]
MRERNLVRRRMLLRPEKCTGCLQCLMACSLKYEGVVSPLMARSRLVKKDDIVIRIELSPECTLCGACVTACHYGARELED